MTLMPHRLLIALTGCLVILRAASGAESGRQNLPAPLTPETRATTVSGFAPVGDVQLYYEIQGAGEPILFVHGGGGSVAGSWPSDYVTQLSQDFRVIVADSRGHGRTADGTGPITYGRLAFDIVRLLDHLGIDRAHVIGHSMGAIGSSDGIPLPPGACSGKEMKQGPDSVPDGTALTSWMRQLEDFQRAA